MPITDIRVVQVWDIGVDGENIPVTHYFEVQRNNEEQWETLEIVNALRRDHRKKEGEEEQVAGNAN